MPSKKSKTALRLPSASRLDRATIGGTRACVGGSAVDAACRIWLNPHFLHCEPVQPSRCRRVECGAS
eukprot:13630296-Alexandrium_andersonii.AAC.1